MSNMQEIAEFLFALLDDIDTASDVAKSDDARYRQMVEKIQRQRFEVASTDGHAVTFNGDDTSHPRQIDPAPHCASGVTAELNLPS